MQQWWECAFLLFHGDTSTMLLRPPVTHFLFLYILMEQSCSPAKENSTCQWVPHELQPVCVPRIWALWSSCRQTGAGIFSLGLSIGVHVVFPWGAISWFGNKDKISEKLYSLCGYCNPGRQKHLPVMEWLLWTLEHQWGKGRNQMENVSTQVRKIACFSSSTLQRTRMIRKELVQDQ